MTMSLDSLKAELAALDSELDASANAAGEAMAALAEAEKAARAAGHALLSIAADVTPGAHAKLSAAKSFAEDRLAPLRRQRDDALAAVDRLASRKGRLCAQLADAEFYAACVAPIVELESDIASHLRAIEKLRERQAALFTQYVPPRNAIVAPDWRRTWPKSADLVAPMSFPSTAPSQMYGPGGTPHGVFETLGDLLAAHYRPTPASAERDEKAA
jgi:hypothetical protein